MTFSGNPDLCQPRRAGNTTEWPRPTPRKFRPPSPGQVGLALFDDEAFNSSGAYVISLGNGFLLVGEAAISSEGTITLDSATLCSADDDIPVVEMGWIEFSPSGLARLIELAEHWEWLEVAFKTADGPLRDPEMGARTAVGDSGAA